MSINVTEEHLRIATELVAEAHRNNGLAPVNLEQFHADQQIAVKDPFGSHIPQCPLGMLKMAEVCVFDELGIPEDLDRYRTDEEWRLTLNRMYNDKAEKIIGIRPLSEEPRSPFGKHPPKGLHDIFEGETVWQSGTLWLKQSAHNETELIALLDRVEKRLENLKNFLLDDKWKREKELRIKQGIPIPRYRAQRGPVTFAMSIYGVENLIFLIYDNPKLAQRFRDLILQAMLELARIFDEEAGYTPETEPHGFSFSDDDCSLLTASMYEEFGYPIVKAIFDRYCPNPEDNRFIHADTDVTHLLPILARLNLTRVNFGPTVMVNTIRRYMPKTVILGVLAPFTFSRNEEVNMVAEFLRDFEMAKPSRGLKFETAGAINNGSRLTGLRLIMSAIQKYGRYS